MDHQTNGINSFDRTVESKGGRMKAEALIERHIEQIHKQMEKNVQRIEDIKEKYPYELYGARYEYKIDRINDEQKELREHLANIQRTDRLKLDNAKLKSENVQLRGALSDVLRQLSHYDPYTADTIKRRWNI